MLLIQNHQSQVFSYFFMTLNLIDLAFIAAQYDKKVNANVYTLSMDQSFQ